MASNSANKKTASKAKTSASSKKSTTSGTRKGNTSSTASKKRQTEPESQKNNSLITGELILLVVLALCFFMFISYFGVGGYLGSLISDVCFGLFGISAYLFPVLLFFAVAFGISNRGNPLTGVKLGGGILLYFCVCFFAALIDGGYIDSFSFGSVYAQCASMKQGGGVIGGSVCYLFVKGLGTVGTAVVFIVFVLIAIILITQKSLFRTVKTQWDRMDKSVKESAKRRKEEREKREEWNLFGEDETGGKELPEEKLDEEPKIAYQKEESNSVTANRSRASHRSNKNGFSGQGRENQPFQDSTVLRTESSLSADRQPELDISVMFPSGSETHKTHQRVEGVTTDTKINGDDAHSGSELHEIYSKPQRQETDQEGRENYTFHIEGLEEENTGNTENTENISQEPDLTVHSVEDSEENSSQIETADNLKGNTSSSEKIKRNPRSSEKEITEEIASVEAEAEEAAQAVKPEYVFPPLSLLHKGSSKAKRGQEDEIRQTAVKLQQTLESFGVNVTVTNVSCGPSVTRYELLPEQGVKVSKIVSLADDIKLNLAASDIRIEAPIPGKSAVGIEVPNAENTTVPLRDLLESDEFINHKSKLAFATGKDIGGNVVISDIAKMPHLLIAGATGSGKSVCINTLIMSILYKAKPDEVKLIMIDPKVVELSVYNGIPHLFIPVVTDPKKAAGALNWAVSEMTDRYEKFAEMGVRDLKGYNQKVDSIPDSGDGTKPEKLPQIVIIVDELADLMMVAPGEVEDAICRLAQLARAAGIHLVIATQRPSVNVITGLIKANMPSRIAFAVTSGVDSRTIIDMYGAEKLLGKGDMLFYPQGYQKPVRVQGSFVSDEEVSAVVDFLKEKNTDVVYNTEMEEQIAKVKQASATAKNAEDKDELFADAGKFIIEKDKASIGMLQRVFKIGFNRAARIMDQLGEAGVVGPEEGTKPRKILMSEEDFENYLEQN